MLFHTLLPSYLTHTCVFTSGPRLADAINVELINPVNSSIGLKRCIEKFIRDNVDLTPKGIICKFFPCGIKPIFYNTARNGHFGYNNNDTYYPWEKIDFSDKLKEYVDEKELSIIEF